MLAALQAELRVLQWQRTWALLFHVCHDDSRKPTFQPLCSGNGFGEMKYSFPWLFPGRFFAIPVTGSEPRASRAGNDSLSTAFDGGWRRRGCVRIRAADHHNQGLFLFWVDAWSGLSGSPDQGVLSVHGQLIRKVNTKDKSEVSVISYAQCCFWQQEGFRGQRQNLLCLVPLEGHYAIGRFCSYVLLLFPQQRKCKHSCWCLHLVD